MKMLKICIFILRLALAASVELEPIYENTIIKDLTSSNFDKQVINSDEIWMVQFYLPYSDHCKKFAKKYIRAGESLSGVINLGAVNLDKCEDLQKRFDISKVPIIHIHGVKTEPIEWDGPKTAQSVLDRGLDAVKTKINRQTGTEMVDIEEEEEDGIIPETYELTDENFELLVNESGSSWFVFFYSPWCAMCRHVKPEFTYAAPLLKGKVKLGIVNVNVEPAVAQRQEALFVPHFKYYAGRRNPGFVLVYNGEIRTRSIVSWTSKAYADNITSPRIERITNETIFKVSCVRSTFCIVTIIPGLLECKPICQNDYVETLKYLGIKYKHQFWGWLWTEAGAEPNLERLFGEDLKFPAMVAIDARRARYAVLKGGFTPVNVNDFLKGISLPATPMDDFENGTLPRIEAGSKSKGVSDTELAEVQRTTNGKLAEIRECPKPQGPVELENDPPEKE